MMRGVHDLRFHCYNNNYSNNSNYYKNNHNNNSNNNGNSDNKINNNNKKKNNNNTGSHSYPKTLGPDTFRISEWKIFSVDFNVFF